MWGQPGLLGERGRSERVEGVAQPGAGRGEGGDDVAIEPGEPLDSLDAQPLEVLTADGAQPAADRHGGTGEVNGDLSVPGQRSATSVIVTLTP